MIVPTSELEFHLFISTCDTYFYHNLHILSAGPDGRQAVKRIRHNSDSGEHGKSAPDERREEV